MRASLFRIALLVLALACPERVGRGSGGPAVPEQPVHDAGLDAAHRAAGRPAAAELRHQPVRLRRCRGPEHARRVQHPAADLGAVLGADRSRHRLELDDLSRGPGGRVVGINQVVWEPAANTLHFESDQQLAQDTTYLLVVTDGVRGADGAPLDGTRSGATSTSARRRTRRRRRTGRRCSTRCRWRWSAASNPSDIAGCEPLHDAVDRRDLAEDPRAAAGVAGRTSTSARRRADGLPALACPRSHGSARRRPRPTFSTRRALPAAARPASARSRSARTLAGLRDGRRR